MNSHLLNFYENKPSYYVYACLNLYVVHPVFTSKNAAPGGLQFGYMLKTTIADKRGSTTRAAFGTAI
ncbi:hypothetical protein FAM09_22540 [Niastella caeni]|uniref:Uncharacterized protein n=1 Tax=Niastella caeni TaxID=2569763 RepID=A0A4S8HKB9_9BACT|nr:hypothetical protein [Niastella caeni]THU34779.1 hypothetical protein FAM09_22540 [Niastella caeni]